MTTSNLPLVGSVWGDPKRPETWRRVTWAGLLFVGYEAFGHIGSANRDYVDWSAWLASGAVDITKLVRAHGA